jgi:outer membrane protein assembly factor BamB
VDERAQRTPTADGDLVYAFSINGELFCLRASDGQKIWQRNYRDDFGTRGHPWGYCDRPLVDGDRLIVTPFGTKVFIASLDKRTGAVIWQTKLENPPSAGHASLIASEAGGVRQYVVFHGRGLSGFAADDGRRLWDYPRPGTRIAMSYTPIASGDMVYSPNGYAGGLAAIRLVRETDRFTAQEVYHQPVRFGPFTDVTAWVGDSLYGFDGKTPFCMELKTGESIWNTNSEPQSGPAFFIYAEGHLYMRQATGTMSLIHVSPQRAELRSRFNIPEHEESYGVTAPVLANGRLWLRDNNRLFCYDVSEGALSASRPPPSHVGVGLTDRELSLDPDAPRLPRVGVNRAPDAVFVPTPHDIVERMLQEIEVKKTDLFVALGSGDGRYVIAAAKKFGCKAIGYEIDAQLVEQSREAVARQNLSALASIEHQDIFTLDLSGADVITVFLYPRLMERLIPQFEKLKPGSRILSHQFDMPGVKPDKLLIVESKEDGDKHRIFLWTTPLKPKPAP